MGRTGTYPTVKYPSGAWASRAGVTPARMGCPMDEMSVFLQVPDNMEPELEHQIREYVRMRELGQQLSERGLLDPTSLT